MVIVTTLSTLDPFVLFSSGGIYEDPRKFPDPTARTQARDGQLDEKKASVGMT